MTTTRSTGRAEELKGALLGALEGMVTPSPSPRSSRDFEALCSLYGNQLHALWVYQRSDILMIAHTRDGDPAAAGGAIWHAGGWEVWLKRGKRWKEVASDASRYVRDSFLPALSGEVVIAHPDPDVAESEIWLEWLGFKKACHGLYYWSA